jgi:hypothetical protein
MNLLNGSCFIGKNARQKAFDLVYSLISAFNDALPTLSWMAKPDRVAAAEKVCHFAEHENTDP